MTAAVTGLNEKAAKAAGVKYAKVLGYSASHASYYPGGHNMSIKTLFDPDTGRILGAQIVGFDGVDKRIDVMATAIRSGLTADELCDLELAYAPPYSSAKDPVNMAGFMIQNVMNGIVKQHFPEDVPSLPRDGQRDDTGRAHRVGVRGRLHRGRGEHPAARAALEAGRAGQEQADLRELLLRHAQLYRLPHPDRQRLRLLQSRRRLALLSARDQGKGR